MKSTLEKLKKGEHVTIVALGDSITANSFHQAWNKRRFSVADLHESYKLYEYRDSGDRE